MTDPTPEETRGRTEWVVLEVHKWPERVCNGPSIVVYHGSSKQQAEDICADLERKRVERGAPFHYEVAEAANA